MKLQRGILLTVLSMHSSLIDAGHHRIQHKHELDMAGKSGKSESMYVQESKSGKGSVQPEHSMPATDDDALSVAYHTGKSGKDMGSKSSKDNSTTKAKSAKIEDMSKSGKHEEEMSMHEVDDDMSVIYVGKAEKEMKTKSGKSEAIAEIMDGMHVSVGKSTKLREGTMAKSGKAEELMSMIHDDDVSYVYTSKAGKSAGKASDAKASKAHYPVDAKSGKAGYASYGKSGKASHSMSMVDDMMDVDGEWVPITTEAAITTVAATDDSTDSATTVPPPQDTTVPAASTTVSPETTAAQTTSQAASTTPAAQLPAFARPKREETIEEELMLLEEGHHGGKDHVHSKAGETIEVSSKIATGNHLRPEGVQQSLSASSSLSISTYSVVAVCVASFFALSL